MPFEIDFQDSTTMEWKSANGQYSADVKSDRYRVTAPATAKMVNEAISDLHTDHPLKTGSKIFKSTNTPSGNRHQSGGGVVSVECGEYEWEEPVEVPPNTQVRLEGTRVNITHRGNAISDTNGVISFNKKEGIRDNVQVVGLAGATLDGQDIAHNGIALTNGIDSLVQGVNLCDFRRHGLVLSSCQYSRVDSVRTWANRGYGLYLNTSHTFDNAFGSNDSTFTSITAEGNGLGGVYIAAGTSLRFTGLTSQFHTTFGVRIQPKSTNRNIEASFFGSRFEWNRHHVEILRGTGESVQTARGVSFHGGKWIASSVEYPGNRVSVGPNGRPPSIKTEQFIVNEGEETTVFGGSSINQPESGMIAMFQQHSTHGDLTVIGFPTMRNGKNRVAYAIHEDGKTFWSEAFQAKNTQFRLLTMEDYFGANALNI